MFQALMNLFRFRLLFVALYPGVHQFSLSAHAQAIYQKQPAGSKLLLILLDGFRHDYLDTDRNELPGFQKMTQMGVKAEYLIPEFPTLSYPNYYSIMTGLYTEAHGMTENHMYDVRLKESFLIGSNKEQFHSHWWDGGDPLWTTAVRQNKTAYLFYWPGCEVEIRGLRPTFCRQYTGVPSMWNFRDAIVSGLDHLKQGDADMVGCRNAGIYFELTDTFGHNYGPLSKEVMDVVRDLDPVISYLMNSLTIQGLNDVNLMIFSDHGMTGVSPDRVIKLYEALEPEEYDVIMGSFALSSIFPKYGMEDLMYRKLRHFHPNMKVYNRKDLPHRWHYKHGKYVAPITCVADPGWLILTPNSRDFPQRQEGMPKQGWHGYDNNNLDMMGIFLAIGPAFRRNLLTEPVHTVDLYQVMCALLGISPSPNNGTWDRINNILAVSDNQTVTIHVSKASAGLTSSFLIMSFMYFLHSRCIER